jgi:RNA polymerase sigma-70 factor (ECF subfamily)
VEDTRQSLLFRAKTGDEEAWRDLAELYRPLIAGWLRRQGVPGNDLDDLTQDILLRVVKYLPSFQHSGNRGAFRSWLCTIICHRTSDYWRACDPVVPAGGDTSAALAQLEDPDSDLNRQWDQEHDRYVLRCLLDLVEQEFEPNSLQAFRRLALDGASGAEAARELGLSVAAVYQAKSRVLQRIRLKAEGLID